MRGQSAPIVAAVLVVQLGKLWLAAVLPLFGDEAIYLFEGRRFAAAYDDVPALAPWGLALAEMAFGNSTLALRLPFLLLSWLTLGLLWRVVRDVWDARTAWRCLLLAQLPPILAMNGVLALPDVGLNLAVLFCLQALQLALHGGRMAGPLLAAGLALGWFSHYRFLLPLAAAGLWLLLDARARPLLLNTRLQRYALLGLLLGMAPLFWHAWREDGAGFAFQYQERHPWSFQPLVLLDPLLQALAVGPLLYLLLLGEGLRRLREGGDFARLAAGLGLALLLLLWLLGPWVDSERSRLHWPLPAYLVLLLPLAAGWSRWNRRLRVATLATGAMLSLGGAGYFAATALAPERLAGTRLYPHNFAGWDEIASEVEQALVDLPADTRVVADHLALAAQLDRRLAPRYRVYSLDHPLNHKHGRARELQRLQRDETGLAASGPGPRLLAIELSASRLRARAAWLARLCRQFPHARWLSERQLGLGEKRLLLLLDNGPRPGTCAPGVVAYLEFEAGEGLGMPQVAGWALAAGSGVDAVRLRIAEQYVALEYGRALPSLQDELGDTGDPAFPRVGFRGVLPAGLAPGRHWVWLQARSGGRGWHDVLGAAISLPATPASAPP